VVKCIIFDLSEVLIAGLLGVERELSRELSLSQDAILACFGGAGFEQLLVGRISEDAYLEGLLAREKWPIGLASLKTAIRRNFCREVEGMVALLQKAASYRPVVLLSDHASEWVAYIQEVHPFMRLFQDMFFSFELKRTKEEPETFVQVLTLIALPAEECLFVDDNPANVRVARSVGIPGIRFASAGQLQKELRRRWVLPNA
jgi:FMN phosphatase YigB (HAD superfamily)